VTSDGKLRLESEPTKQSFVGMLVRNNLLHCQQSSSSSTSFNF